MRGATEDGLPGAVQHLFQSTRPMRGATLFPYTTGGVSLDFNPRAPCGARQITSYKVIIAFIFQSTRPVRGATRIRRVGGMSFFYFNPRAPCGARRRSGLCSRHRKYFNPRAPCGARRAGFARMAGATVNFNPRAPCGARLGNLGKEMALAQFQSTRPMRGATHALQQLIRFFACISIHAPHAGRDHT